MTPTAARRKNDNVIGRQHAYVAAALGLWDWPRRWATSWAGLFVVRRRNGPAARSTYFLAPLGAGFMLGTALIEMVPEAIRLSGEDALFFVLAGYFLVHLFEHTLAAAFPFRRRDASRRDAPPAQLRLHRRSSAC